MVADASEGMLHVMEWHNGDKEYSPFSDQEMARRQNDVRAWMAENDVDACLFTSYHCINYYSGWLYCYFGRKYGLVIDHEQATTISAGIDGGQPWRRSFSNNITYSDWRKDNYFRAVRDLTKGVKVVWGMESEPTYPTRDSDTYLYYSDSSVTSAEVDDFDGAGTYYVRVCEYLGGECGVYSNEIEIEL